MKKTLDPVQFNFAENWFFKILPLRKTARISEGFRHLQEIYEEIAQWEFDETDSTFLKIPLMDEFVKDKLDLEMHTARVKCFDLHWILETFEADQMVPLSVAIAASLYPGKEWFIIGDGTEEAVVTDTERTIVFDLKNFKNLSAGASLALAGDPRFQKDPESMAEALAFREARLEKELEALQSLQKLVNLEPEPPKLSLVLTEPSEEPN